MPFKPTAGEIANIWQFIITNQSHVCLMEHWMHHAEDPGVQTILKQGHKMANWIVKEGITLYKKAGFPPPIGFSVEKDVTTDTPKLMTDQLVLTVLHILSEYGVYGYGLTLGKTVTPEVLSYFQTCLKDSVKLYQMITEEVTRKGQGLKPVYAPAPERAEMIEHQNFLFGWRGEQRSLILPEVDNLLFSFRGVLLAKMMFMIFEKLVKDPEVKKIVGKAKKVAAKRLETFQNLGASEGLPFQPTFENDIAGVTESPYSDRLILFKTMVLAQISVARYGNALSSVMRRDLNVLYAQLIVESGLFIEDAMKVMIDKKWMDQPPLLRYEQTKNLP
jgi:hypothetical protein